MWYVRKRFHEIISLNDALTEAFPRLIFPTFPKKVNEYDEKRERTAVKHVKSSGNNIVKRFTRKEGAHSPRPMNKGVSVRDREGMTNVTVPPAGGSGKAEEIDAEGDLATNQGLCMPFRLYRILFLFFTSYYFKRSPVFPYHYLSIYLSIYQSIYLSPYIHICGCIYPPHLFFNFHFPSSSISYNSKSVN